jgi:hypothetical protein
MKLFDDGASIDRRSIYDDAGSFFEKHPLSSPTISMSDRPQPSETNSIRDLNDVYDKYIDSLQNPAEFKQKDIQASFENYVQSAAKMVKDPDLMSQGIFTCPLKPDGSTNITGKRSEKDTLSLSSITKESKETPKSMVQRYKFSCGASLNEKSEQWVAQGELATDSYSYFLILNKVWVSEYIKKSDVKVLQPCKILLLRSIIKRKFDEELALQ